MAENTLSSGTGSLSINFGALMRAILAPLFIWGAMVVMATMGGQPGVVCITPMAWLLALWAGTRYGVRVGYQSKRSMLLGAALLGIVLGISFGLYFVLGMTQMAPDASNAADIARTQGLTAAMFMGGVIVCPLLSMFTAWTSWRRVAEA